MDTQKHPVNAKETAPADITDDPQYQAWVESMAQHCRCTHDCPCAGVLAGGLCDGIYHDELETIFDDPSECDARNNHWGM